MKNKKITFATEPYPGIALGIIIDTEEKEFYIILPIIILQFSIRNK